MAFMTYLACHQDDTTSNQPQKPLNHKSTVNKRSPTVLKNSKEIGDYILCRTIGRGASGHVKLGIHKQTGEKVAIKMISRSQLTASSTTSKSVQRELAVLQLLHHPNLIDLHQVLQDGQYVYFVMEYLEGGELFHVLAERGRLPESEARSLFIQLITALTWCHAHHISHRDLKPENILLDKEKKNIKIADFGMAVMQPYNTLLKTSCGSPHYASPEIVRGKKYDGTATDVWSCGAILYAMVTGHLPFDDEHMARLLSKIKTGRYRTLPDSLSSDARDLIQRMLVVDPTKRMTMMEILVHPWLTNKSFLGTELRFLQQQPPPHNDHPLHDPQLQLPVPMDLLDGRIWETLKVLWREKTEQELLISLTTQGCNVQKLTCKLLQERSYRQSENHTRRRSSVISEDVPMTPPLGDIDSSILSTASSMDTCCKTLDLPPTPKSTTLFHQQRMYSCVTVINEPKKWNASTITLNSSGAAMHWMLHEEGCLAQTQETRGSKTDVANVFIMTHHVESPSFVMTHSRSAWWLCSKTVIDEKKLGWWDYLFSKVVVPEKKVITIECFSKHECETAGKLHQVLEECYHGKLTGRRMYPHGKIVWRGTMIKKDQVVISFRCHMKTTMDNNKVRIHFVFQQQDHDVADATMLNLLDCLNRYQVESDWVTKTNGWVS